MTAWLVSIYLLLFETGSHFIDQFALELMVLRLQPPEWLGLWMRNDTHPKGKEKLLKQDQKCRDQKLKRTNVYQTNILTNTEGMEEGGGGGGVFSEEQCLPCYQENLSLNCKHP